MPQRIFARVLTTRWLFHSLTAGPAIGRERIQAWNLGDDLEKRYAERIMNGVVGMIGTKAPNAPKAKLIQARTNQTGFTESFSLDPGLFFPAWKVPSQK